LSEFFSLCLSGKVEQTAHRKTTVRIDMKQRACIPAVHSLTERICGTTLAIAPSPLMHALSFAQSPTDSKPFYIRSGATNLNQHVTARVCNAIFREKP
jgi:hypothetical protein